MIRRLGYACDNITISKSACHSCRKSTVEKKGLTYISQLVIQNLNELTDILKWNLENNIMFYRISSGLFPNRAFYDIDELPQLSEIKQLLSMCGDIILQNDLRVSFHPDHYCVISSHRPEVVQRSIHDLNMHGKIMDYMNLPRSNKHKINIHIGTTNGGKIESTRRFINSFNNLDSSVKTRLTIENDDRPNGYSVKDLKELIWDKGLKIPIVFDYHHHRFCDGGLSEQHALEMACNTWVDSIVPVVHYSESWCIEQNDNSKPQRHSKYIYNIINTYDNTIDVMLECKAKDLALMKYKVTYE